MTARLGEDERKTVEDAAYDIRRLTVEMVAYAQWGHIAGSISMARSWPFCISTRCGCIQMTPRGTNAIG